VDISATLLYISDFIPLHLVPRYFLWSESELSPAASATPISLPTNIYEQIAGTAVKATSTYEHCLNVPNVQVPSQRIEIVETAR